MTRSASQPPQEPQPQPPKPPGPHDPPGGPTTPPPPLRRDARPPASLRESQMYPGMESFHPEETCHHGQVGTPVRAINSRQKLPPHQ